MAHKWRRQHPKCIVSDSQTTPLRGKRSDARPRAASFELVLEAAEVAGSSSRFTGTDEVGCGFLHTERLVEGHGLAADRKHQVDALLIHRIQVVGTTAHDGNNRLAIALGTAGHAHRRLTGGGLLVHIALARYDQVDIAYTLVKPHEIEHRLHTRA